LGRNNPFKIKGNWRSEQVVNLTQSTPPRPLDMQDKANQLFKSFSICRENAYDGKLVGLCNITTAGDRLLLTGTPVRFSEYLATRNPHHPASWPRANPVGTTAILITQDNYILTSVRSLNAEQNPGGLYFVGGFSEYDAQDNFDLFTNARRETEEETGLQLSDILSEITLCGIDYDSIYPHPEAFFIIRLTILSSDLQEHLQHHHHEEAERFELLSKASFLSLTESDRLLTWSFLTGRQLIADTI